MMRREVTTRGRGRSSASYRPRWSDDDGSTLLLTIFYSALSLVLVLLVTAASSLYLERKRLFTLADGAAVVGAEAFDLGDVVLTPGGPRATLRSSDVKAAVTEYVGSAASGPFTDLEVVRAATTDGRSATVTLSSYWTPPVLGILMPRGIQVDVTSVARSVLW